MGKMIYFQMVSFGLMLCFTGVGIVFGIPLIILAEEFRRKAMNL